MKFLSFVLVINFVIKANSEFYSSIDKLRDLFAAENETLNVFASIFNRLNDVEDLMDVKLRSWYDEHAAAKENVEKYITNPLNAFLMIKRNVYDAELIHKKVKSLIEDLQIKLESLEQRIVVEKREVSGAVAGLLRIQRAYLLKSEDLVEGIIDGQQTREPLTPHDIFVLASEAFRLPDETFFSKSYFKILKEKLKNQKFSEIDEKEIGEKLFELDGKVIENPFDETFTVNGVGDPFYDRIITRKLCRGDSDLTRPSIELKNLRCRFIGFSPFSSVAPFKLEEVSHDPYIVLYHEMISDAEIDKIIELARPKGKKAEIGLVNSEAVDRDRLAQSSWLYDNDYELLGRLSTRFEDMTGLNMKTAEPLQAQNYGLGGLYNPHYDINWDRTDEASDARIATLMLYVSFFSMKL